MQEYPALNDQVLSFVESCCKFKTNIKVETLSTSTIFDENILLLGTLSELKNPLIHDLPFVSPLITHLISTITEGSLKSQLISHNSSIYNVMIGCVPSEASRHNCPVRPDVIDTLLNNALKQSGNFSSLDVISFSPSSLPVALAVARGSRHSFSGKDFQWKNSFQSQFLPIRILFEKSSYIPEILETICESLQLCQRLVDAPTCLLNVKSFSLIAEHYARELGCDFEIIEGEDLRINGYGGIYGVGKCATEPPALVTLTYTPAPEIQPLFGISLVGKGIVYDTGGLALKTCEGMLLMKKDMGGAAGLFCAFLASVRMQVPVRISCTLCLAENAIGPNAYRNGDILVFKSGLTAEITNTDAEGRVVLSDGIYHASHEMSWIPDIIVDMATLTGAQVIATGTHHAAIFSNNENEETRIRLAGLTTGDLCFPVIFCPEFHRKELESNIADQVNTQKSRSNASISCAAQFIYNNISKEWNGSYVHLDIAAPSFNSQGATGYGVALIAEYITMIANQMN